MKRFAGLIFSLCLLLFVAERGYSAKRMTSPQEQEKARYAYFEALRLKGMGRHAEAFDLLRHAIELDTTLAAAYSEVAGYYFTVRDAASGYRSLLKAVKFAPHNSWYLLSAAECARQIRDYDKAIVFYTRYLQIKPADLEVVSRLAETYMDRGEPQKAIETYTRFEEQYGANENTILQKANIYYRIQDHEQSFEEMKSLIASNPHDVSYRLLLGDLYLESARYDEAFEMYMQVREMDPEEESLHLSLLNYYRLRKEKEAYWAETDTLLFRTSLPGDVRMSVLQYVIQDFSEDIPRLDSLMARLCDSYPNDVDLREVYSDILIQSGSYDRAQEQLEAAIALTPTEELWQTLFRILIEENDLPALIEASRQAIESAPGNGRYYLVAASSQLTVGLYDEAEVVLREGMALPEIASNPLVCSEFYALLGDIAFQRGEYDESCTYYEKSLEYNPQNYVALNNYSYYLALLGKDLDRAERMSGEVIKANPNNATYLDTYAWVYFKQKRYSLARLYLKKAIELSPEEAGEMYEHYGDVLFVLGDEAEALEWWQKAVESGGGSSLLQRKIEEKKYIDDE